MWHDYQNARYRQLYHNLDDLAKSLRFDDTRLCACFNDPQHCILPRLMAVES
jgi:hypothetical protein